MTEAVAVNMSDRSITVNTPGGNIVTYLDFPITAPYPYSVF